MTMHNFTSAQINLFATEARQSFNGLWPYVNGAIRRAIVQAYVLRIACESPTAINPKELAALTADVILQAEVD